MMVPCRRRKVGIPILVCLAVFAGGKSGGGVALRLVQALQFGSNRLQFLGNRLHVSDYGTLEKVNRTRVPGQRSPHQLSQEVDSAMLQTWKRRVELADLAVSRQSGGNFAVDRCRLFRPGVSFRKVRRRAVCDLSANVLQGSIRVGRVRRNRRSPMVHRQFRPNPVHDPANFFLADQRAPIVRFQGLRPPGAWGAWLPQIQCFRAEDYPILATDRGFRTCARWLPHSSCWHR